MVSPMKVYIYFFILEPQSRSKHMFFSYYVLDCRLWTNLLWYQLLIHVALWHIMLYIYIVIFKGDFNDMYRDVATCISFSIQGNFISVEKIDWIICSACILTVKTFRSYATILNRCNDIIIFKEWERFEMYPSSVI